AAPRRRARPARARRRPRQAARWPPLRSPRGAPARCGRNRPPRAARRAGRRSARRARLAISSARRRRRSWTESREAPVAKRGVTKRSARASGGEEPRSLGDHRRDVVDVLRLVLLVPRQHDDALERLRGARRLRAVVDDLRLAGPARALPRELAVAERPPLAQD